MSELFVSQGMGELIAMTPGMFEAFPPKGSEEALFSRSEGGMTKPEDIVRGLQPCEGQKQNSWVRELG